MLKTLGQLVYEEMGAASKKHKRYFPPATGMTGRPWNELSEVTRKEWEGYASGGAYERFRQYLAELYFAQPPSDGDCSDG